MSKAFGQSLALCLAVAFPGAAAAFSAQDVLTYCQATHADPGFLHDKLRSSGWTDVNPADPGPVAETLALSILATWSVRTRTSVSPSDWQGDWATAQQNASRYLTGLGDRSSALLLDPETSSLILATWTDGPAIRMHCLLAVTEAATKSQSYHPRLQQPDDGNAFYVILEGSDVATSRISTLSLSVSLARSVVEGELGLKTDVVSVFQTMPSYPASAVRP